MYNAHKKLKEIETRVKAILSKGRTFVQEEHKKRFGIILTKDTDPIGGDHNFNMAVHIVEFDMYRDAMEGSK
jgi:hypothetical protein